MAEQIIDPWTQEQIDELVDRFYGRLTQNEAFIRMFAERNVDIELLKERQRSFIARLANGDSTSASPGEVQQVQQRHTFGMDPGRTAIWIEAMKVTMDDMNLPAEKKETLLAKIQFLLDRMSKA